MQFFFCSDGVGRTGTFIMMHAQMEKIKSEGVMDIFQFIKSARYQRAGLVASKVVINIILVLVQKYKYQQTDIFM